MSQFGISAPRHSVLLDVDDIAGVLDSSYAAGARLGRASSCLRNESLRALC